MVKENWVVNKNITIEMVKECIETFNSFTECKSEMSFTHKDGKIFANLD